MNTNHGGGPPHLARVGAASYPAFRMDTAGALPVELHRVTPMDGLEPPTSGTLAWKGQAWESNPLLSHSLA